MSARQLARVIRVAAFISLAGMLISGYAAQAQEFRGDTCENLWEHVQAGGEVIFDETRKWFEKTCAKEDDADDDSEGGRPAVQQQEPRPPVVTCPALPPSVKVFGHVEGTQCQMVGGAGVGNMDVIKRGLINAVDIWSYVNGGIEVCFRNTGWLVFLDAHYVPRMLMELASFQRDGMTCGAINGPGTVALVRTGPPTAPAAPTAEATPPPPGEPTLPTFDRIPTSDCQIKLQETLFLRAEPAGEIIGLVWLYSEVPVFEVNGDWYKVEFEGQAGYISRFYRKVLRGGCA